jgi:hypothetical protein
MSYAVLSRAEARKHLGELQIAPEAKLKAVRTRAAGADLDWEQIATSLSGQLDRLKDDIGDPWTGTAPRGFEKNAAIIVHEVMPNHVALSDPEFWTWLTISHFVDLVKWRYPGSRNLDNFGVGTPTENLLFRAWLRGEISFDPGSSSPYAQAEFGDIDFWRSHMFRQSYAEGHEFAQALIAFQFPAGQGEKGRLSTDEIRMLAPRLKTARSNLLVELMDKTRATRFIQAEWNKLAAALGKDASWNTASTGTTAKSYGPSPLVDPII